MFTLTSLFSLLGIIPDIIILAVTFNYFSKARTRDAAFLFIGSLLHIFVRILYWAIPYFSMMSDNDPYEIQNYFAIPSAVAFIGGVIFCVGLVMLLQRVIANLKQN